MTIRIRNKSEDTRILKDIAGCSYTLQPNQVAIIDYCRDSDRFLAITLIPTETESIEKTTTFKFIGT